MLSLRTFSHEFTNRRKGAVAAPAIIGDVLGDGLFEDAYGGEGLDDFAAELLIRSLLAGETGVSASAQAVN